MSPTEERLLEATRRYLSARSEEDLQSINLDDAICQDLDIFGIDVDEYVWALEEEFGSVVWTIPWLHYTDQTSSFRGCGCLAFPPWLLMQFARKAIRGGPALPLPRPKEFLNRLTLRDIASTIDRGGGARGWRP